MTPIFMLCSGYLRSNIGHQFHFPLAETWPYLIAVLQLEEILAKLWILHCTAAMIRTRHPVAYQDALTPNEALRLLVRPVDLGVQTLKEVGEGKSLSCGNQAMYNALRSEAAMWALSQSCFG